MVSKTDKCIEQLENEALELVKEDLKKRVLKAVNTCVQEVRKRKGWIAGRENQIQRINECKLNMMVAYNDADIDAYEYQASQLKKVLDETVTQNDKNKQYDY